VSSLDEDDRGARDGIPVTSVARTLLDQAAILPLDSLRRAFEQAERLRLLDVRTLYAACERSPRRHGLRAVNLLLAEGREPWETRSELERRFVELCRNANLPMPTLNAVVAGYEVDAVWMNQRIVVELDGYAFHRTRAAFERDRARDIALQLAGYRVLRLTSRRLHREPDGIIAALRSLLEV
jgi:very-short-patch-repair endonuclease